MPSTGQSEEEQKGRAENNRKDELDVLIEGVTLRKSLWRFNDGKDMPKKGEADLVELAQWMERQYSGDFSYLEGGNQPTLPFTQSPRTGSAFYNLSFNGTVAANTYTLQAVPTGDQTNDTCGTLRITQTGARSSTSGTDCW